MTSTLENEVIKIDENETEKDFNKRVVQKVKKEGWTAYRFENMRTSELCAVLSRTPRKGDGMSSI